MITIKGVGVDSSFSDNVKKIGENGFNEILLPKEDINTDKFKSFSKFFTDFKKYNLKDSNILIAGRNDATVISAHFFENMTEIDYLRWSKSLLKVYHQYGYKDFNFKTTNFPDSVEFFGATDNKYNMHYVIVEKMKDTEDKFTILSIVFSPTNLGLTFNSNGGYTRHNTFRKNEDFTVGEVLGAVGTLVGIFGFM